MGRRRGWLCGLRKYGGRFKGVHMIFTKGVENIIFYDIKLCIDGNTVRAQENIKRDEATFKKTFFAQWKRAWFSQVLQLLNRPFTLRRHPSRQRQILR